MFVWMPKFNKKDLVMIKLISDEDEDYSNYLKKNMH